MSRNHQNNNPTLINGYANVNGISMYYEIYGSGKPIVLVHGGGSTIQSTFEAVIPVLAKNRQVIGVELQAHGRTSDRDAPESFDQDADDVAALMENLSITKADFFGFSNGGSTVLKIAIRYPLLVNKVIAASALTKRDGVFSGFFEGMKDATIDVMPQALKDAFMKVNADEGKLLNMFNKDKQRMVGFTDWNDEDITSIKAETLLVNADKDVISISHTAALAALIPNSRVLIVPSNHGGYLLTAETGNDNSATVFNCTMAVINEFLDSNRQTSLAEG